MIFFIKWKSRRLGIFCYGAFGYASLEILSRGYTHWSMMLAGGLCLLLLFEISARMAHRSLLVQAAAGALGITVIEFCFGVVFNLWLGQAVWSYAGEPFNLLGQVCLYYTGVWYLLSLPVLAYFKPLKSRRTA